MLVRNDAFTATVYISRFGHGSGEQGDHMLQLLLFLLVLPEASGMISCGVVDMFTHAERALVHLFGAHPTSAGDCEEGAALDCYLAPLLCGDDSHVCSSTLDILPIYGNAVLGGRPILVQPLWVCSSCSRVLQAEPPMIMGSAAATPLATRDKTAVKQFRPPTWYLTKHAPTRVGGTH